MTIVSNGCLDSLKVTAADALSTEIAKAAKDRLKITPGGQALLLASVEVLASLKGKTLSADMDSMINEMSEEAKQTLANTLAGQLKGQQGIIQSAVLLANINASIRTADGSLDKAALYGGIVSAIGKEMIQDTSKIKNPILKAMVETALNGACAGANTATNMDSFLGGYPSIQMNAEGELASTKGFLTKTPLAGLAMSNPVLVAALNNEKLGRLKNSATAINQIVTAKGMDVGFDTLTQNVTNKLPSNIVAKAKGLPTVISKIATKNILVDMADAPQETVPVNILKDSEKKIEEAILSLREEGSVVTPSTVKARMQFINKVLPPDITDANIRTVVPTIASNIEAKASVLDLRPSISPKDGAVILKESVIKNIKSPYQSLKAVINSGSNDLDVALNNELSDATMGEDANGNKVVNTTLSGDENVTDNLNEAKAEQSKADELDEFLKKIPETPKSSVYYEQIEYENEERSQPIT